MGYEANYECTRKQPSSPLKKLTKGQATRIIINKLEKKIDSMKCKISLKMSLKKCLCTIMIDPNIEQSV